MATDDYRHVTEIRTPCKTVTAGRQKQYWVEFQLLDEQGEPLAGLPYRAVNDATRGACAPEYFGHSDANGLIRIEGLHPIPLTLFLSANPLAQMMQTRHLRAVRAEPPRPIFGKPVPAYGPQPPGFSPIEKEALAAGHGYHYLRIGQLCDEVPVLEPGWDEEDLPGYHFPDPNFSGFTIEFEGLDRRNVLEVCPFRAWSLVLNHRNEYCIANAYNLGLMSILAYSNIKGDEVGSVYEFFLRQCLDLSRTPRVLDNGQGWPCLVTDVRFDERYIDVAALDTKETESSIGDIQLFYAYNTSQVIVSWRGTEFKPPYDDLVTDLKFRPVYPPLNRACDEKAPCGALVSEGKMHLGFREAYELAENSFSKRFNEINEVARNGGLFICGHSLGGALALIHAVSLRRRNPVLYTYGMPRTFTAKAIYALGVLTHFRHVNDTDIVTRVPPEADLDNKLYNLYGAHGASMGFARSVSQLMIGTIFGHDDPFIHHGEIVMFLTAEQHVLKRNLRADESLKYGGYTPIAAVLPIRAKLYLVPSLSEGESAKAEDAQKRLFASFPPETRAKFFPPQGNVKRSGLPDPGHHSMSQYQPYIHNQLLELINPELMSARIAKRKRFETQMSTNFYFIPADEITRDRAFLYLQSLMGKALMATKEAEGGEEALTRLEAIADPLAYYERTQ